MKVIEIKPKRFSRKPKNHGNYTEFFDWLWSNRKGLIPEAVRLECNQKSCFHHSETGQQYKDDISRDEVVKNMRKHLRVEHGIKEELK